MRKGETTKDRRQRVLNTAGRLIERFGFDKTTMEEIAREAGVSKGALYLEWASKDELLDALLAHEMKRLLHDFLERTERDPEGGRIANLYTHALLALQSNPLMCALYTRDSRVLGDFVRRQDVGRYTSRLMFGKQTVKQMQSAGLLRADIRPQVLAYVFTIIALGFMSIGSLIPSKDAPPPEEVAAAMSKLVEGGLAGKGGDSAAGKQAMAQMARFVEEQYGDSDV
jgi:AcrR family transcriptional regulator